MAKAAVRSKDPTNFVHQNAILCETIGKETRTQKLYTNYNINPFKKMHVISGKPNSLHDTEEGAEDASFRTVIKRAHEEPVRKYVYPQTEAQEIGWVTQPLIDFNRSDTRLNFPRQSSAITRYMDVAMRGRDQMEKKPLKEK